jgi:hypothetical protein
VGRREVQKSQVGRGKEVILSESLTDSVESSCQQGVLIDEDLCGFVYHVNEDDENLNTLTIQEEHSDHWGNSDIPSKQPSRGHRMCCRCNNRRRKSNSDYHDERTYIKIYPRRRGRNGADTYVYPNKRGGSFKIMAQMFQ